MSFDKRKILLSPSCASTCTAESTDESVSAADCLVNDAINFLSSPSPTPSQQRSLPSPPPRSPPPRSPPPTINNNNNDDDDNNTHHQNQIIKPTHSYSHSFGTICSLDKKCYLPPLFHLIENHSWTAVCQLLDGTPLESQKWATVRTKTIKKTHSGDDDDGDDESSTTTSGSSSTTTTTVVTKVKRLPLHHACLKLRHSSSSSSSASSSLNASNNRRPAADAIMALVAAYPEAASMRESRHGCLPLHLAAFASAVSGAGKDETTRQRKEGDHQPRWKQRSITKGLLPSKRDTLPKHTNRTTPSSSSSTSSPRRQSGDDRTEEDCLVSIVKTLLSAYPKAARVDSEGGRLPLHMACSGRACWGVVKEILAAYPSAARHRTRDGSLPLHLAASWGVSSVDVATSLLRAYPDAAFGSNRHGRTPLEEALYVAGEAGRENQAALVGVLRKHPSFWSQPPSTLSVLFPKKEEGGGGRACTDASFTASETEDEEEEGEGGNLNSTDSHSSSSSPTPPPHKNSQSTIFHLASTTELTILIRAKNWPTVTTRLELRPAEATEMLTVTSLSGRTTRVTPLHYALERAPPTDPIEALVESHHEALSRTSVPGGQLPLHVACTWGATKGVVGYLIAAYPKAVGRRDDVGNLPIHAACYSGAEGGVIESLLCVNPKSVWATNGAGSTPIDIVKRLKHENRAEIVGLLKRHMVMNMRAAKERRRRASGNASNAAGGGDGREEELKKGKGRSGKGDLLWI